MKANPIEQLNELIWSDVLERQGRIGRIVANLLRYLYAVLRDIFSGQITMRAMSLVYTTLLSIVPLLAFSFSVLKGLGIHEKLEGQMYLFLEPLGDRGVEITDNVMALVYNVNGRVLGGVSLAFFLWTAISMVQKVEESLNYVWYVSEPRSFARRFTEYMFVLMIGPLAIVIALGMITGLQNQDIVKYLLENDIVGPLFVATSKLMPYFLVAGVFTFLYWFMPNTRVRLVPALLGGLTGGFIWASMVIIFTTFVATASARQAVYASFAIAIVTLIWLYLNWLILLIGAQLAFYVQNPAYLKIGRQEPRLSNSVRERLALNIMLLVGRTFRDPAERLSVQALSDTLQIPSLALAPVIQDLQSKGLLTTSEKGELLPAREMARIQLRDILQVTRCEGETGSYREPAWDPYVDALGEKLDDATLSAVGSMTLSELVDAAGPLSGADSAAGDSHAVNED
ncbi:MAG: YihY/virulence factor BrkB family protein [Gammaproteobacteria bacterium]|jgi:membrane protein|nr:YihY/virulence factor BrkB family protein [Gammaproteobacteria bacterium]MDH3846807.1 YihY/virulence factor BrkB family protein [Gammaproteobacteria bacterium]MDH3863534.1 YihY/virulence factor BrkB family protein [Gammaproteobacteria bacterium]MDH3904425.1 YihY/virulence factor BrkB family protein [Gammaproteobacteria bacterium]MDH4004266.1 YihY/virulence factor BrkB family protein [Gammaproteobacteria bacterium]